jgi:hypothetical protein
LPSMTMLPANRAPVQILPPVSARVAIRLP